MIKQLLFLIYVLLFTSIESYILDNVCIMGPKFRCEKDERLF